MFLFLFHFFIVNKGKRRIGNGDRERIISVIGRLDDREQKGGHGGIKMP